MAIKDVVIRPIKLFEAMYGMRSDLLAPDRYLTIAVLVMPKRNISTNAADDIKSTHSPNMSFVNVLASNANPANPKSAITRFPARERKLSSRINMFSAFFTGPED